MTKLVCLDPGHTKTNQNSSPDRSYYEWEFNQDVVDMAARMFSLIPGIACIKTKERDRVAAPEENMLVTRTRIANDAGADVFLSQHTNAADSTGNWSSANGVTIYRYPGQDLPLAQLGSHASMEELDFSHSRGIKEANFHVLRESKMPSILFETGFHTNREDVAKLKTREYRERQARVLVKTACRFLSVPIVQVTLHEPSKFHRVISGDTMPKISRVYNISQEELVKMNPHIPDPALIYREGGGDIIFLAYPSEFEIDHAKLQRAHCLLDKKYLDSIPRAEYEALQANYRRLQQLGTHINTLSADFLLL